MLIGEMAARTGVSRRSLRHYEQKGLLAADRSAANGYRRYSTADVARAERIKELVTMGLPLTAVAAVLPCLPADLACPELASRIRRELARIDERAAQLAERRRALAGLLDRSRSDEPGPRQAANTGGSGSATAAATRST
jgi:DNA-binding transcriptional MerR regulator